MLLILARPARAQTPTAGYAVSLDGVDDYVSVPAGQINLANSSFTIEFWAKRARTGAEFIVGQGTGQANQFLHIGFRENDVFSFNFWSDDLATGNAFPDQNWHHWACTYNTSNRARTIYRDGVVVGSDTASANFQGTGEFHIGEAFDFNFKGQVDDLRVWNVVRTQTEIQALMFAPIPFTLPGIVALHQFNQEAGLTAEDSSTFNRDGTLMNGAGWVVSSAPLRWSTRLIVTTSAQTFMAGSISGTITVQRQHVALLFGGWVANTSDPDIVVNLSSSSSAGVFRNTSDTANITSIAIPLGQSSASFRYKDTIVGTPVITTSSTGLTSSQQTATINPFARTVTTLADSGLSSLRQALLDQSSAGVPGTIDLSSLNGTITLQSALPLIELSTTIIGPGANQLTISGNNQHRVFFVDAPGASVQFERIRIADGRAKGGNGGFGNNGGGGGLGAGGGIFVNAGAVKLVEVSFSQNSAIGGDGGGEPGPQPNDFTRIEFDPTGDGGGGGLGSDGGTGGSLAGGGGGGFGGRGGDGHLTSTSGNYAAGGGGGRIGKGANGNPGAGGGGGALVDATSQTGRRWRWRKWRDIFY